MKKIYLLLILPMMFLWACEKDTEDISEIQKIPTIKLKGPEKVYLKAAKLRSSYEEIGYKEEGATTDVGKIKIVNNIPENNIAPGVYYVKYIAVGDGVIRTEKYRTVVIYEDDGILSGIYTAKTSGWGEIHDKEAEVVISTVSDDGNGNKVYKCADMYASHFVFWKNGKYPWIVANSNDITIDDAGVITASSEMISTEVTGQRIDGEHVKWSAHSLAYSWITVEVELTKKNFK